jgi:hypothetical protein
MARLPSLDELEKMRAEETEKEAAVLEYLLRKREAASGKTKTGLRFDAGKRRVDLFPMDAFDGTCDVLTYGATKKRGPEGNPYGPRNWEGGLKWIEQCMGPLLRHISAFMQGEDIDPESGLPHTDHMGCDVAFLQAMYKRRKDLDDRPREDK